MYFSFRKTTLCYVSPSRDLQISLVIDIYFLIYFFVSLEDGRRSKLIFGLFMCFHFQKFELDWKMVGDYLACKHNLESLFYKIDDGPLKWWNRWNSDIHLLVLSLKSRVGVFSNLLSSAIKPPNNIKLLLSVFLSVWLPKIYNPFLAWQKSQWSIFFA